MIVLIGGASHTGKTLLAQRLLEEYHWPYLSIDHLKMGLIRSGQTVLTPMDEEKLGAYLWPVIQEIVKTAIENGQNLIVEGCYIPSSWRDAFSEEYLPHIRCRFLVMTEDYICRHFDEIRDNACAIESRLDDSGLTEETLIRDNLRFQETCREEDCLVIGGTYQIDLSQVLF